MFCFLHWSFLGRFFQAMGWSSVTVSPHFDKIHSNNIKEKTKTVDYCISNFQLVAMK